MDSKSKTVYIIIYILSKRNTGNVIFYTEECILTKKFMNKDKKCYHFSFVRNLLWEYFFFCSNVMFIVKNLPFSTYYAL